MQPAQVITTLAGASAPGAAAGGLQLAVKGVPLEDCLNAVAQTLHEQARAHAELQAYTYKTNQEQWDRIVALEAQVTRIERDLNITARPVVGEASTFDALNRITARVNQLDQDRRGTAATELSARTAALLRQTAWRKWLAFMRQRRVARTLFVGTRQGTFQVYYGKWQRFLELRKLMRARQRHIASTILRGDKQLLSVYMAKWVGWQRSRDDHRDEVWGAQTRAAEAMLAITSRGTARRYFEHWQGFLEVCRGRHQRRQLADRMAAVSTRVFALRFLRAWQAAEQQHRRRRRMRKMAVALELRTARVHCGRRLTLWIGQVQRQHRRLRGASLVPRMCHLQCVRLAQLYYTKLLRNAQTRQQRRQRLEQQAHIDELSTRCDAMNAQVHVSLKTVSNANSVMVQLVDRVVDLERALKIKARSTTASPLRDGSAEPTAATTEFDEEVYRGSVAALAARHSVPTAKTDLDRPAVSLPTRPAERRASSIAGVGAADLTGLRETADAAVYRDVAAWEGPAAALPPLSGLGRTPLPAARAQPQYRGASAAANYEGDRPQLSSRRLRTGGMGGGAATPTGTSLADLASARDVSVGADGSDPFADSHYRVARGY